MQSQKSSQWDQCCIMVILLAVVSACGAPVPSHEYEVKASTAPAGTPCTDAPSLTCYAIKVPLNHDRPNGKAISVTFAIHPARASKRGALLIPGGGPGQSSIIDLAGWLPKMDQRIRDSYDIVSFDLRGG